MDWLADGRRGNARALWPAARAIIMLGLNYGPDRDPLAILAQRDRAAISVYAQGDDYHDVIKKRLKSLAQWLIATAGGDVKVFVDTAALMEKPLAAAAGIGWQGKHTNLVSRSSVPGCLSARYSRPSTSRPIDPRPIIAEPVTPVSTSARPRPSRRRIGSMRDAASPISRSSIRVRSRASCAR